MKEKDLLNKPGPGTPGPDAKGEGWGGLTIILPYDKFAI